MQIKEAVASYVAGIGTVNMRKKGIYIYVFKKHQRLETIP